MKTAVRFGCILSLIFAFEAIAQSKPTPPQPPLVSQVAGRTLTFTTVRDPDATPAYHYIKVYDAKLKKTFRASQHPFIVQDGPITCNMLEYLRAWLTEADNGVNGKKTKDKKPLPGAEAQASSVRDISGQRLSEDCPEMSKLICKQGDSTINACADLKSLQTLSNGICQEAKNQSDMNLKGQDYY